jgi:hypothetical protein
VPVDADEGTKEYCACTACGIDAQSTVESGRDCHWYETADDPAVAETASDTNWPTVTEMSGGWAVITMAGRRRVAGSEYTVSVPAIALSRYFRPSSAPESPERASEVPVAPATSPHDVPLSDEDCH